MKFITLPRAAVATVLAGLMAAAVVAQPASTPASAATTPVVAPAPAPVMTMMQVLERITAQGYRDIREVELDDGVRYEIEARDSQGQAVELHVDARSGEILKKEVKRSRAGGK